MARDPKEVVSDTNGAKEKIIVVSREELLQSQLNEINQKLELIYSEITSNNQETE